MLPSFNASNSTRTSGHSSPRIWPLAEASLAAKLEVSGLTNQTQSSQIHDEPAFPYNGLAHHLDTFDLEIDLDSDSARV